MIAADDGDVVKQVHALTGELDARDRVQLVILAYEAGLVSPST
ncbi:hypothetical protein ACIBP6_07815 [Nonomuraea terrae]